MNKYRRQAVIAQLLREQAITSQHQLMLLLKEKGIEVSQATLSRDLAELGAVRDGATKRYVLPKDRDPAALLARAQSILKMMVKEVSSSGNVVVVKTGPGQANTVAHLLDTLELPGLLGTVAGDNTILCVVDETHSARALAEQIRELARG